MHLIGTARSYFDTVKHHIVLDKVARRVNDDAVLWLLKNVLSIRIHNASSAGPRDIAELKQIVTGIFERSGINVLWVDYLSPGTNSAPTPKCDLRASGASIGLVVVNGPDHVGCDTLGWTNLGVSILTINYRLAENIARASKVDISCGRVLAHATVHEVGHLLLGSRNHDLVGIMKATYNDQDLLRMAQGRMFFTAEESRLIRARLLAR